MPKTYTELLALYEAGDVDAMLPERYAGVTPGIWNWESSPYYDSYTFGKENVLVSSNKKSVLNPHDMSCAGASIEVSTQDMDIIGKTKEHAAKVELLTAAVRELRGALEETWGEPVSGHLRIVIKSALDATAPLVEGVE